MQKVWVDGETLTPYDLNTFAAGEGGAWDDSWSPTVTQLGAVTLTDTRSRFARYGRTIHFTTRLTNFAGGTAGNGVQISLPTAHAAAGDFIGWAYVYRQGGVDRSVRPVYTVATDQFEIYNFFVYALDTTDMIDVSGTYQAAS